jgi:tetratricopeptide (TPR) repeat protein
MEGQEVAVRISLLSALVLACAVPAFAQAPAAQAPSPQKLFEAGQYDQAAQAFVKKREVSPLSPAETYLAGQVYLRANQNDKAKEEFARLAAAADPNWKLIGESAVALMANRNDEALNKINEASARLQTETAATGGPTGITAAPKNVERFHALYQMGLVKSKREDWAGAADAFEKAAQLEPNFAYAHYYAGLAYSRIQRPDKVATHFEHFLTIAPNAPERAAVMSIMRTIRGR